MLWQRAVLWIAPAGLRDCGHGRTQGLVALAGLRTLGSGRGHPAGACPAARQPAKELDYRGIIPYPALHKDKRAALWERAALWVAPAGLRDCGHGRTQGLVTLAGLRTLGSGRGRPAGACPAASGQLAKERTTEIVMPHLTQHSIERAALGVALIRLSGLPRRPRKPL